MATKTTFFSIGKERKINNTNKLEQKLIKEKILLEKHESEAIPGSMTYIDFDGSVKDVTGDFYKNANGTYVMNRTLTYEHPIYEKQEVSNVSVDAHYSYLDKDGVKRTFNNLDTLNYDEETNTYTGLVSDIEYETLKVELFTEKDKF